VLLEVLLERLQEVFWVVLSQHGLWVAQ